MIFYLLPKVFIVEFRLHNPKLLDLWLKESRNPSLISNFYYASTSRTSKLLIPNLKTMQNQLMFWLNLKILGVRASHTLWTTENYRNYSIFHRQLKQLLISTSVSLSSLNRETQRFSFLSLPSLCLSALSRMTKQFAKTFSLISKSNTRKRAQKLQVSANCTKK